MDTSPDLADIEAAARRIAPHVHRTPVVTCAALDRACGAEVMLKCEHLQKTGAFKFRGATNALLTLDDADAAGGVITHSSGNHGAALACAARVAGRTATVVMPRDASRVKRAAVAGYGGRIVDCEPGLASRERTTDALIRETGARLVHPYDDIAVIAGQGTAALELLEECPELDLLIAPVGGGGLLAGTAVVCASLRGGIPVIGAEPEGADDAARSLRAGRHVPMDRPRTIADGLHAGLGALTWPVIQRHAADIVTVADHAIVRAMRFVWERAKLLIEPSAAVPIAALMEHRLGDRYRTIGVILSGGNVDLDRLPFGA